MASPNIASNSFGCAFKMYFYMTIFIFIQIISRNSWFNINRIACMYDIIIL